MAKLVWALLSQRVIIDAQTNLVSYIDALDAVTIEHFPLKAPPIFVSAIWQRDAEKRLEMRVRVYSPEGKQLLEQEANPLEFESQHKRGRMTVAVAGFDIATPGRYEFGVETKDKGKWTEATRIPFDVDAFKA